MRKVDDNKQDIQERQEMFPEVDANDGSAMVNDGCVIIASISNETDDCGITELALEASGNPFNTVDGFSSRKFVHKDIGKKVVCSPLLGTDRLMIVGLLPENHIEELSLSNSVLDDVLTSTESSSGEGENAEEVNVQSALNDEMVFYDNAIFNNAANKVTVIADGEENEHLLLRAEAALTLQCGDSSITLTSDGRVRINGRYIHTRASHTQRLSGGAVKIN